MGFYEDAMRDYLLEVSRRYAEANGVTLSTVSRHMHGAVTFLEDFQAGRVSITLRKFDAMLDSLWNQWPKGVVWPACKIVVKKRRNR
jgi:hypothetical protein